MKTINTMQAVVDAWAAQEMIGRSNSQMTLGALLLRLAEIDPEAPVAMSGPHSYRGYYSDLAFEPTEPLPASAVLLQAKEVMGRTLQGYKGGDYVMHENVPVWVSSYGSCGKKLMAIGDDGALTLVDDD